MGSVKFLEYQGKRILLIDISHCELEEIVSVVKECKKLIAKEKEATVYTLTNITGIHPTSSITRVINDFVVFNKPYVKAGAVIGVDGLRKIAFNLVIKFSSRNFALFDTLEEGLKWLVTQN